MLIIHRHDYVIVIVERTRYFQRKQITQFKI